MNPPADLDPLAQRLAGWIPAPAPSGRDRILFEAGVVAGRRQARWQSATIVAVLLIGSGGWIWHERIERHRVELALIQRSIGQEAVTQYEAAPTSSLKPVNTPDRMSDLVLSHRLDVTGWDRFEPIDPRSDHATSPSHAGTLPILTPLSSRHLQVVTDL